MPKEKPLPEVPVFLAWVRDKEGSWFLSGMWPLGALQEGHPEHRNFNRLLDTYPEVVCYDGTMAFARFVRAQEVVR